MVTGGTNAVVLFVCFSLSSEGPAEGSERKRERESEIERAESDSESKGRGAAAAGQAKIVGGRVIWSGEYTKVAAAWHTEKKRMVG